MLRAVPIPCAALLAWAALGSAPPALDPVAPDATRDYAEVVELVPPREADEGEPEPDEAESPTGDTAPSGLSTDAATVPYDEAEDPVGEPPGRVRKWWRDRGHRFIAFPSFRGGSGIGAMPGVRFRYVRRLPGQRFNRVQVDLAARISTRLVQQHELSTRLRDLFGKNELLQFGAFFFGDPVFPYMGIANQERLKNADLDDGYYQAKVLTTGGYLNYQHPIWTLEPDALRRAKGVLRWLVGADVSADRIRPYKGSLLEAERPEDRGWIRRGYVLGGLTWDSRDNEWSPTKGGFHEASIAMAGPWAASSAIWSRFDATFRWYRSLGTPKLVFAQRLTFDALIGPAPLYELGTYGGLERVQGFGGRSAGRGFYRRRFAAPVKGLSMTELRYQPFEFPIFRRTVGLGLRAFADLGEIFRPDGILADGFHIAGGGGLFLVWDQFFVFRGDVGVSPEGVQWYVFSGHAF